MPVWGIPAQVSLRKITFLGPGSPPTKLAIMQYESGYASLVLRVDPDQVSAGAFAIADQAATTDLLQVNGNQFYGITGMFTGLGADGSVQTTNAAATQVSNVGGTPGDGDGVYQYLAFVEGRRSTGLEGAGYLLAATFRLLSGVLTQIGATTALFTHEDVAAWDATINASGLSVRVMVTGAAGSTINWKAHLTYRRVA